jgi:hypothetical protein
MEKENIKITDELSVNEKKEEKLIKDMKIIEKKIEILKNTIGKDYYEYNITLSKISQLTKELNKIKEKLQEDKINDYFKYVADALINKNKNDYTIRFQSDKIKKSKKIHHDSCPECKSNKLLVDDYENIICRECGNYISSYGNFKIITNNYDKIGHLINSLAQQKIKKNKQLPQDDYEKIIKKLKQMNISELKPKDVRRILKNMGYNKYYSYVPKIYSEISGESVPQLSESEKRHIYTVFREVEEIWEKYVKPKGRKNFISYKFIIRQILEYLGYTKYLDYYYYSEDQDKLNLLQHYWNEISEILNKKKNVL